MSSASSTRPLACVMGDLDLVRPLGLAGIPCVVVAPPSNLARYSRFTRAMLEWEDFWQDPDALVAALLGFGAAQPEPPVLFYQDDAQLLLVSRYRDRLAQAFRFVVADAGLVEDLVDKARFQELAERLDLGVPATRRIRPYESGAPADLDLRFPLILKPLTHRDWWSWDSIAGSYKALPVETPEALRDLWSSLAEMRIDLLAQEFVPGTETCIESYHVYVDRQGEIVGEFTGKKVRTYPVSCGRSTAVVITNTADVLARGRDLVRRLMLHGVAKIDFKRGTDGRLYLLEVNPRFSLWHHPGAVAGVNLPALVFADLVGLPRRSRATARAGVQWRRVWTDLPAARASGVPMLSWLHDMLRSEAKYAAAWDDPMPLLHGVINRCLRKRIAGGISAA